MRKSLTIISLLLTISLTIAQNRDKAFQINANLGKGINFGNMFEAPSETAWGNQWQPEYPEIVANLGFNHIRIPIRWEPSDRSSATPPYTISTTFLNRIKQVVDSTLNKGLYAIINMHHHEALYDDPDGQKDRFLAQWKQISQFFKDYPDTLLFEILNEPHGNMTSAKWNVFLNDGLLKIREDNSDRVVLIGTAEYGGLGGLSSLQLPNDDNIILTIHYYNPFQFTHQGADWVGPQADEWLGTTWDDTEAEREIMRQEFAPLLAVSQSENIPIHIGEFGAFSTADLASRVKWTTFLSRYLEQLNWSWAYWEFSAGFGIYDPNTERILQELSDALLVNEMPEAAQYEATVIYASDFNTNTDGWTLNTQQGASATLTRVNNSLQITIANGGSETWHIQLSKTGFNLEDGKKYRLRFKAESANPRNITAYLGMSANPWTAYSDYLGAGLTTTMTEYSTIFDMKSNDSQARAVFDLGNSVNDVTITEIFVEELKLQTLSVPEVDAISTKVYPNPVINTLFIQNLDAFTKLSVYNMQGQLLKSKPLLNGNDKFDMQHFKTGLYFVTFNGYNKKHTIKVMKL